MKRGKVTGRAGMLGGDGGHHYNESRKDESPSDRGRASSGRRYAELESAALPEGVSRRHYTVEQLIEFTNS